MTLERWNPLAELEAMRSRMDLLLEKSRLAAERKTPGERSWQPPADIYEDETRLIVEIDLPGVPQEAIQVQIENGLLLVEGTREPPTGEESLQLQHCERSWGGFSRQFALPPEADSARTLASCDLGVLRIVIPKAGPPTGRIEIEVKKGE